jgi:hypothetical protein
MKSRPVRRPCLYFTAENGQGYRIEWEPNFDSDEPSTRAFFTISSTQNLAETGKPIFDLDGIAYALEQYQKAKAITSAACKEEVRVPLSIIEKRGGCVPKFYICPEDDPYVPDMPELRKYEPTPEEIEALEQEYYAAVEKANTEGIIDAYWRKRQIGVRTAEEKHDIILEDDENDEDVE